MPFFELRFLGLFELGVFLSLSLWEEDSMILLRPLATPNLAVPLFLEEIEPVSRELAELDPSQCFFLVRRRRY